MALHVRNMGKVIKGKTLDDAGHIVANILGGKMKLYNLFPQNRGINRESGRTKWRNICMNFLKKFGNTKDTYVEFEATLIMQILMIKTHWH